MRRASQKLLWVLLLLFAQQVALTHAIWHAHEGISSDESFRSFRDTGPDSDGSYQSQLCVFDIVFGEVLGAAGSNAGTLSLLAPLPSVPAWPDRFFLQLAAVSPQSRGPPVLS